MWFALLAMAVFAAAPGSLDTTFGVGGKIAANLPGAGFILDAAVQPDGKIVAAGYSQTGETRDFVAIRLMPNGAFDPGFGTGGVASADFSGRYDDAYAVAIQADGKIVVAGASSEGGFADTAVARFLPNGELDASFDGDGRLILTAFPGQIGDTAFSLAIQADGKIVGGGSMETDFLLFRLRLDGSLDPDFGNAGITTTNANAFSDDVRDLAILPDGKLLAAGGSGRCVVARYGDNGILDPSYGAGGLFTADPGFYTQCSAIAMQPDGKAVIAGEASPTPQYSSMVARLSAGGSLDTGFGLGGYAIVNVNPGGADWFTDVAVQPNGKIVAAGYEGEFSTYDFSAARLTENGQPDASFGTEGIVVTDIDANDALRVAVLYGDKLIGVGDAYGDGLGVRAVRYNLSAQPTASSDFDGDGTADHAVFRPSEGAWYVLRSATQTVTIEHFGTQGDVPIDGDFDGDAKSDPSVFRPSTGEWWINTSSGVKVHQFGQNGDRPVAGDYDKDGRTDAAVWRPSNGVWYVLRSSDGGSTFYSLPFGQAGDIPIQAAP